MEDTVYKKIRIAICDDEPVFPKLLADILKEVLNRGKYTIYFREVYIRLRIVSSDRKI